MNECWGSVTTRFVHAHSGVKAQLKRKKKKEKKERESLLPAGRAWFPGAGRVATRIVEKLVEIPEIRAAC